MKHSKLFFAFLLMTVLSIGQVWGDVAYIDITTTALGLSGTTYASSSTGVDVGGVDIKFTDANVSSGLNFKKTSGCLWNGEAMPQKIDSIVLSDVGYSSAASAGFEMYGSTSEKGTTTKLYDGDGTGKILISFTSYNYTYFYLKNKGTRTTHASSIKVYYTTGGSSEPTV